METLLVGIDAACAPVLSDLAGMNAEIPTLRGLLEEGASGPLESQIPPWTASAWPSLFTGTNPGKHGVFSFLAFEGYDWDVVNATHLREPALWELLDSRGLSSVVVNVPVTHPPRSFSGALIPGYTAPENPACHPEGVLDEVRQEIGSYRVYPPHEGASDADRSEMVANYRDLVRTRGEAFRLLADRYDPDFGFVQFQATDSVFHERPGDMEAVRAVYEAVDDEIRETLDACEPRNTLVASDHGIGRYDGYEFRVNEFLREAGYVETKRGGESGMPAWGPIRNGKGDDDPAVLERAMALAATVGVTSQRVGGVVERLGLTDLVLDVVPQGMIRAGTEQVDFPNSRAYMRERIELGIRINLEGREPNGIVPETEYEAIREDLIARLRGVRTPDGEPVFERVVPRETVFHGPAAGEAVDVVTVPREFDQFLSATLAGERFGPPTEPYNHKLAGIVAVHGEDVDTDTTASDETDGIGGIDGAHLFDVAPTVLATLSLPRGEHMDGDVLSVVESADEAAYPAIDRGERVATDDGGVERRLSDLGYIE
jgi:predicted AlkP superfamily phosphohydrolase/phosphomutase